MKNKRKIDNPKPLKDSNKETNRDNQLILYNDNIHTFEYVINTLIDVCNHSNIQAEQCTYLVHYNGKCAIKQGNKDSILNLKNILTERGLNATVE